MSCQHRNTRVVSSRRSPNGPTLVVFRERWCEDCKSTIYTREIIDVTAKQELNLIHKALYEGRYTST